jgi:hypothetical protein
LLWNASICNTRIRSLASDVERLENQFDQLEAMDSLEARSAKSEVHILHLVKGIHSIFIRYEQDLKLVPNADGRWTGNATEALLDRLRKISQYVKACEELLRAARRYRIFSNINVQFVDLQQVGRRLSLDAASDANDIIEANCARETLSKVSNHRNISISDTMESIKAQLTEKSRLHAEIQLILNYQQDFGLLRPRVLCSSKSACYLCQLLITLHGQYYIPSTHGKLYDTWKWPTPMQLPDSSGRGGENIELQPLLSQFIDAIDRKLQHYLGNASLTRRFHPLESRVDLRSAMSPSIPSYELWHSIRSGATHHQRIETNSEDTEETSSSTSKETVRGPAPLSQTWSLPVNTHEIRSQGLRQTLQPLCLRKGENASHSFNMENSYLEVHVPGLHVGFQYDASPSQGSSLHLEIECFPASTQCNEMNLSCAMDLEELHFMEKPIPEGLLFSEKGLLLKGKSTLLCLRATIA